MVFVLLAGFIWLSIRFCLKPSPHPRSPQNEKEKINICRNPEKYRKTMEQMKNFVMNDCWNSRVNSFVQYPGAQDSDASLILMGKYRLLPMDDPRLRSTYDYICRTLSAGPGLFFRNKDLNEGAFDVCTLWCVEYLAEGGGSLEEAEELFDQFLSYGNELGLFSEETDPETKGMLGNYPLAFTHLGIIQAALAIEKRRKLENNKKET
jgi:GH15 family glucan-1,4-alpha-glucosidase